MENSRLEFDISNDTFTEIETWLNEEYIETGEGFFKNFDAIEYSFSQKRIAVLIIDNKPIGFVTWNLGYKFSTTIEILAIKPSCRDKNLGDYLVNEILAHFKQRGILVVDLQCSPYESMGFWKKMGFTHYPSHPDFSDMVRYAQLYKLLLNDSDSVNKENSVEFIELYDDLNHEVPIKKWSPSFKGNSRILVHPIIHPISLYWKVKWIHNGKVLKFDEPKYFPNDGYKYGTMLIITELPALSKFI